MSGFEVRQSVAQLIGFISDCFDIRQQTIDGAFHVVHKLQVRCHHIIIGLDVVQIEGMRNAAGFRVFKESC